MVESSVVERGVLTTPGPVWDAASRRAEVIGKLAAKSAVGLAAADEAADALGISRRQVYLLVGRWRAGERVVSDLLPGRSSAGAVRADYRTRSRRSCGKCCAPDI